MIERLTFYLFTACMLLCALTALTLLWLPELLPERLIGTFFIIGFANFLLWAPQIAYRFLRK